MKKKDLSSKINLKIITRTWSKIIKRKKNKLIKNSKKNKGPIISNWKYNKLVSITNPKNVKATNVIIFTLSKTTNRLISLIKNRLQNREYMARWNWFLRNKIWKCKEIKKKKIKKKKKII